MEVSEGLKTSEIISITISVIALILSLISFIWNRVDISQKNKKDKEKWEEQTTADEKRDKKISKYNKEIKKLKKAHNEILNGGLKDIKDSNLIIADSILTSISKLQKKEKQHVFDDVNRIQAEKAEKYDNYPIPVIEDQIKDDSKKDNKNK